MLIFKYFVASIILTPSLFILPFQWLIYFLYFSLFLANNCLLNLIYVVFCFDIFLFLELYRGYLQPMFFLLESMIINYLSFASKTSVIFTLCLFYFTILVSHLLFYFSFLFQTIEFMLSSDKLLLCQFFITRSLPQPMFFIRNYDYY